MGDNSARKCALCLHKDWKHFVRREGNVGVPYCSRECAQVGESLEFARVIEAKRSRTASRPGESESDDRGRPRRAVHPIDPGSEESLEDQIESLRAGDPLVEPFLQAPSGVRMDHLVGSTEEKAVIYRKIIAPLAVPHLSERAGLKHENVLLYGPGGTGKTAFINAMARELGYGIIQVRRSDVISEWSGRSTRQLAVFILTARLLAERIRTGAFTQFSGLVLFIDEADAILADTKPGAEGEGLTAEFKARVSEIGVPRLIIAAATNFPDKISDSGVLRRFGLKLYFGMPNEVEAFDTCYSLVENHYRDNKQCVSEAATDPGFYRTLLAHMNDGPARRHITELVRWHTPAEIAQMVRDALGSRTPDLSTQTFMQLSNPPRWVAIRGRSHARAPNTIDGKTLDAKLASGDFKGIAVCWPVPSIEEFMDGLRHANVKRSVTRDELKKFMDYALNKLVDREGARRISLELQSMENQ